MNIILTRPLNDTENLMQELFNLGHKIIHIPTLKISSAKLEPLKIQNYSDKMSKNSLSIPLKEAREKFEKEYLTIQLKKFNGNISKTANFVGMERSALHRKLKGLGIKEFN